MKKRLLLFLGIFLLVSSCSEGSVPEESSTLTIAPPSNPYLSSTSTPLPPTPTPVLPTTEPLLATATPFKHSVQPGETLSGIAIQYNITLDQLILANPGVDTSLLTIGTELVIPRSAQDQTAAPTPTPIPLAQEQPVCFPAEDGGMWCYQIVENQQSIALENITMAFNIYSETQELTESLRAIPPLNLLPPGESIVVGAYLDGFQSEQTRVTSTLLTAFPADIQQTTVEITDYSIQYSQENRLAEISGTFAITAPEIADQQVWIAGIAFNSGDPVGLRKWVSSQELQVDTPYPFSFTIYSLGPRIDRVQLLGELH